MRLTKASRSALIAALLFLSVWNICRLGEAFTPPDFYGRDFLADYVMGAAALHGDDPYRPVPDLADAYVAVLPYAVLTFPSPHPPPVALLFLPFALLTYYWASVLWLACEAAFLLAVSLLLTRYALGRPVVKAALAAWLLSPAWLPVFTELAMGQLMIFVLLLVTLAFVLLRSGRDILGGAALGGALAVKLFGWPLVVYLLLRRRWRAAFAAGATAAALNLLAGLLIGFDRVAFCYLKAGPHVTAITKAEPRNFSAWTVGPRFFPEGVAPYASAAAVLLLVAGGLHLARRARDFDAAFAALVCVSLVVNPVSWIHYLPLLAVPLAVIARREGAPPAGLLLALFAVQPVAQLGSGLAPLAVALWPLAHLLRGGGPAVSLEESDPRVTV